MPKLKPNKSPKLPKLCKKNSNSCGKSYAYVRINRQQIICGEWNSPEADQEYRRILAENAAGIISPKQNNRSDFSVAELLLAWLKSREKKDQHPAAKFHNKDITKTICELYAEMPVCNFDVNCLRTIRQRFIEKGFVRQKVNWRVNFIKRIFRFGVSFKLVPPSVLAELQSLTPLRKGDVNLPESQQRKTVDIADIEKTVAELSPIIAAMVKVHLATAARPSEVCSIRIENIDRSNSDCWSIKLDHHKTDYQENSEIKTLFLSKDEIAVIEPIIRERTSGYLFRPSDALQHDKQKRAEKANGRNVKKQPSRLKRDAKRAANPKRELGNCYDASGYRKAVERACERAGVQSWFPYSLRHTGVTLIGLEHGVEVAQAVAGHSDIKMTMNYFHGQDEIKRRVALKRNELKPAPVEVKSDLPMPKIDENEWEEFQAFLEFKRLKGKQNNGIV